MLRKSAFAVTCCAILITGAAACGGSGKSESRTSNAGAGDATAPAATAPIPTTEPGTTVKSGDGKLSLFIPDGAIPAGTNVSITALPHDQLPAELRQLAGSGAGYRLEPDRLVFGKPATATLTLDRGELDDDDGTQSAYALVSFNQTAGREVLDSETHTTLGDATVTVTAQIKHFSWVTRTKGSLTVGLIPVEHLQAVGATFKPVVSVVVLNEQVTLAPFDAAMLISGVLEFASEKDKAIHYDQYTRRHGTSFFYPEYTCLKPGIGSYGTHVTAVSTVRDLPNQHTSLALTLDGSVQCTTGPVETPGIPSPTPSASTPMVHLVQTLGCEHTQPGVQSELRKKGRITDANGTPIRVVRITEEATGPGLVDRDGPAPNLESTVLTDTNGEFVITWTIEMFGPYSVKVKEISLANGTLVALDETSDTTVSYTVGSVCTPP